MSHRLLLALLLLTCLVPRAFAQSPAPPTSTPGDFLHCRNADEFLLLAQHGMTPMSAIVAATVNAAVLLGLADQIGTIEPGKSADIVALRGDPLGDAGVLRSMNFVARGQVYRRQD